jgi:glucose-1-phosphate thymidylyltransferase
MQSLLQAAEFVEMIQSRQGITISAPEEIAFIKAILTEDVEIFSTAPNMGQ